MNKEEILRAVQAGELTPEQAEKELREMTEATITKQSKQHSPENQIQQAVVDLYEVEPGVVQLTMQDRVNKNTFSYELVSGLMQSFELIKANPNYKVVILTGYDTYFASGGTKEGLLSIYEGKSKFTDTNIYSLALDCKIPVIAAMQGHAIGAGWSMGMFCDLIVMGQENIYTSNYIKYGFTPGAGATMIFPEKFGISLSQEILYTGKKYHGSELKSLGISFPVLPRKEVLPYAIQLAKTLAESPREALIALKDLMAESIRAKVSLTYEKELKMHERTFVNQPGVKERIQSQYGEAPGKDNNKKSLGLTTHSEKKVTVTGNTLQDQTQENSIAIIGIAGQFPEAKTLAEFWDNVAQGTNCISEVPQTRWSIDEYYDPDPRAPGKTNCKFMGALEDVAMFDPLFFGISPAEAEFMDPQQRLFLESCWSCIEDAGLNPSLLSGSRFGVFAGCAPNDYGQGRGLSAQAFTGGASSILAARISYLLNLKGPSLAIDTACSSSLVAIVEACNSLILQNSDLALAGGVYVMPGPAMHIQSSKTGMLSQDGRCFAFDNRANGFVPGEGVGVVLLKRLSDAVRDHDPIHGVIRGWGINQDGKTNGITAPSVHSQILLEKEVYQRFGINPETITLVEAHGTGTKLGDPIEVEALTEAFQSFTQKKNYCALGSVKSNIGHLLLASGAAGVIKMVLALQHQMLPPTINFEKLNEHICLENTPFYVNTKLQPWEVTEGTPRRACVSGFGFSGTNAHVVIEEYHASTAGTPILINTNNPIVFVLSAKSEEQLKTYAESMKSYAESHADLNLADVAYTLQVGREAMEHRLAFLADSRETLVKVLEGFVNGTASTEILSARVIKRKIGMTQVEDTKALLQTCIQEKKLKEVAEFWVKGFNIDWDKLYVGSKPKRISLPTYPFAREYYWIPASKTAFAAATATNAASVSFIHPLLHQNTSDFSEQRFSSTLTGQEFFLADHVIKGQRVLPGVAYLEMARAAVEQATGEGQTGIRLKNVIWARPVVVGDQPARVHIRLLPEDNGDIAYNIYSEPEAGNTETVVYSQGSAVISLVTEVPALDLKAVKAQCCQSTFSSTQCYEMFRAMEFEYGPGHQGIEEVYVGSGQVLAKLSLPSSVSDTQNQFVLHPSLVDSALQASVGLMMDAVPNMPAGSNAPLKPSLPFALQELEVLSSCTPMMWALIQFSEGSTAEDKVQKLDVDLCDEQGKVCVRMKGFSLRVLEREVGSSGVSPTVGTLMLQPCWSEKAVVEETKAIDYARHLVMLCEPNEVSQESIETQINGVHCLTLESEQQHIGERFKTYAVQVFKEIQSILQDKPKGKVLIQVVVFNQEEQQIFAGLSGLLKTAQLENPQLIGQIIEVEPGEKSESIIEKLKENSLNPIDKHIRYRDGKRLLAVLSEVETSRETARIPWKDHGVYLITGGAGGLGLIFAREIADKAKDVTVILTGRSPLSESKKAQLEELQNLGARIEYKQVDVTQKKAVDDLIQSILADFGSLHGIIHSAGVIRDNFILKKTKDEFSEVMAPKVIGLVNLDQATIDLPLDFFILFSSIAGILGNSGQADYAAANTFMDSYAAYRNALVATKQRQGQTLSINWPLWQEGGMHVDEETEKMMRQDVGMIAMQTLTGIRALYQGLDSGKDQVMVMEGDLKRLQATLLGHPVEPEALKVASAKAKNKPMLAITQDVLEEKAINYFKKVLSSIIKLPPHRIEAEAPMEKYGIDSIMGMQLTNQLEVTFGSLSKTLFFEYQTIKELTGYFIESYRSQLIELLGIEEEAAAVTEDSKDSTVITKSEKTVFSNGRHSRFATRRTESRDEKATRELDIAIIGVAGRYPQARNIQEFWQNLQAGKDCITEIPKERWDHSLYFDEDKSKMGKTYCKWGGFLEDVDQFDPFFFNISPRDAGIMDPMCRLYLETVWHLLESAGYTRETLQREYQSRVGIYVGAMYQQYQVINSELVQESAASIASYSYIANRISHYFNLQGPSIAIDTMCSSASVAIHMACESLIKGECQIAIAGGVNLSIHPKKYLGLSLSQIIGSHSNSRSFGNGDGYLPSEGVGAVLLKPLDRAIRDQDSILAVIKSTAINHGGHTNGFSVPNPTLQAQLIEENFKKSGIDPRTISYVEAAANGSALGDPIEVTALSKAFQKYTTDQQFCAIGSVKSNIGHAEAASGISQITKVILQLQHQQLVPSIKAEPLNPNINFNNTPFYLQQRLQEWKRAVVNIDGNEREIPRSATVSSFGAGGSNAHLILEEYIPYEGKMIPIHISPTAQPQIAIFSAKTPERLQAVVQQMLEFIQEQKDISLVDLAYTLQLGREAMESRVAMVASTQEQLIQGMKEYLKSVKEGSGDNASIPVFTGNLEDDHSEIRNLLSGKLAETVVQTLLTENNIEKIALYWTQGGKIPWELFHKGERGHMISLPTYPFERRLCWVKSPKESRLNVEPQIASITDFVEAKDDTSLDECIVDIVSGLLGMAAPELNTNRPLEQYGFDSILLMSLFQRLQSQVDPSLNLDNLRGVRTTQDIIKILRLQIGDKPILRRQQAVNSTPEAKESIPKNWSEFPELIHLNLSTQGRPVFWFHGGLGGVEAYQGIAQKSQRPFYGIQARGWMNDRSPLHGIQAMAAYYIDIIRSVQPEGPYDLGGYSLGGCIAYEVTRQLQNLGQVVDTIVMLDSLDNMHLKETEILTKTMMLQAVNMALLTTIMQEPEKIAHTLIQREELNSNVEDEKFFKQLITIAKTRGLTKRETQLHTQIQQSVKVQQAYEVEKYLILPLPDPQTVTCYYFRNKSGLFFGELKPYFVMEKDEFTIDHMNYWKEWKRNLPKFHMMDADSSNHFAMLSEPKAYEMIIALSEKIYSQKGMSLDFFQSFVKSN